MKESTALHGVFMDINGSGVLITGQSGIGKSELALDLVANRGHRLIADDYVIFEKEGNALIGSCPPTLQGFLAIRDLGIINLVTLLGQTVISAPKPLALVIELLPMGEQQATLFETYLQGAVTVQTIMNINIPKQSLILKPYRTLATLVETCVGLQRLKQKGHDAATDFIALQQQLIENNA